MTEDTLSENKIVTMGYIRKAVGLKGWVKVKADTETPDAMLDYSTCLLGKKDQWRQVRIENGRLVRNELHIKFLGIDGRDEAEQLQGQTIAVKRHQMAPTEKDEYYWTDLVGLAVINRDGVCLGHVKSLLETGSRDVLVVDGDFGEKMIPFVSVFVDTVCLQTKSIIVDWGTDY